MEREIKRERERQSLSHMTTCDRIDRARKREENALSFSRFLHLLSILSFCIFSPFSRMERSRSLALLLSRSLAFSIFSLLSLILRENGAKMEKARERKSNRARGRESEEGFREERVEHVNRDINLSKRPTKRHE